MQKGIPMPNPLKLAKKISHGIYWRAKMVPPLYRILFQIVHLHITEVELNG